MLSPGEREWLKMEQGTRYPCAPPPEECKQPEHFEGYCTTEGNELRPPTAYPMKPMKGRPHILCLHGTACNTEVLKIQLRVLTEIWSQTADISFIEGARVMTNPYHPTFRQIGDLYPSAGFQREYVETLPIDREAKVYGAFDWALAKFEDKLAQLEKPVDVLVGFSQGALFATLVAARALKINAEKCPAPFRCVVLLCPPNPISLSQRAPTLFSEPLPIPAFICKGLEDDVVPGGPEMYESLYKTIEWCDHPSGHQPLPSEKADAEALSKKIIQFVKKNCS